MNIDGDGLGRKWEIRGLKMWSGFRFCGRGRNNMNKCAVVINTGFRLMKS